MAGSPPVVTENSLSQGTVTPGGSATWITRATDATARTVTMSRTVTDNQGNATTVTESLTIGDALVWGPPQCDDPAISFLVDPNDPEKIYVSVSADA